MVALIGKRLNYEISGIRSKVIATGRKVGASRQGPYKDAVIAIDKIWGEPETWATIKRSSSSYTPFYLLAMLDMRQGVDGSIEQVPADRAVYIDILKRTLGISLLVTFCTLILGYPVAYMLATTPQKTASILMIFVLLPFWTSLLVRTTAWMILMQDGGVFAQFMNVTGITWLLNLLGCHGRPAGTVQDALCHRRGDDPHPAALHAAADLLGDEDHLAQLHARGEVAGGHALLLLPPGLHAADASGRGGGLPAHLHPVPRLLHHARAGGRPDGPDDVGLHRRAPSTPRTTGARLRRWASSCSSPR